MTALPSENTPLAVVMKALDPYYSELAPGGSEDAASDVLDALARWVRSDEQVVLDRMRGHWRDSLIIQHEHFDALVMAVVIEVGEALRER